MPPPVSGAIPPTPLLPAADAARVTDAIAAAERRTSAELKLIVVRHCWGDVRDKAARLFRKHGLDRTRERNAVLILLVTTNREFAVYGDKAIHARVGESFWVDVGDTMLEDFRAGRVADGLCAGVRLIGDRLAEHFPVRADDVNEIPDAVVHDD